MRYREATHGLRRARPAKLAGRRRPLIAERLEGRALMDAGGHLDLGFGPGSGLPTTGIVDYFTTNSSSTAVAGTQAVAVQANGDILLAGVIPAGVGSTPSTTDRVDVVRLLPSGNLDTSFGVGGQSIAGVGAQTGLAVTGMLVQPDGKVVVLAGASTDLNGPGTPSYPTNPGGVVQGQVVVLRYDANGGLDTTYGQGAGFVTASLGQPLSIPGGIALQADGKIVVDGTAVLIDQTGDAPAPTPNTFGVTRLNADGTVDTTFGTNGVFNSYFGQEATQSATGGSNGTALAIQADGKILVGGREQDSAGYSTAVARLTTSGALDTTFGIAGKFVNGSTSQADTRLALTPNGGIIVAFAASAAIQGVASPPNELAALKLTPAGQLDLTFTPNLTGFDGYTPALASYGAPKAVAVQPDGQVVILAGQGSASSLSGVLRLQANGIVETNFTTVALGNLVAPNTTTSLAIQANGKIVVGVEGTGFGAARLLAGTTLGDYTGDGLADPAIYLPSVASFAIRPSEGGPDQILPFGLPGVGASIPTPGDYDGSGKTELAVYLPSIGSFAYRPANGGPDQIIPFGLGGPDGSIPAPGDYDGDGVTDLAVYLPSFGAFAIRPSTGGPDQIIPFGIAGAGQSIPAPGDYDNSGKTELAVYLPSLGVYAYRPANGGADVLTLFGQTGPGNSIPTPADYDGLGKTNISVYIPSQATFYYRPSTNTGDVATPFGAAGANGTIPAPADYTGDGQADVAGYLPGLGVYAYRPSHGGPDFFQAFGLPGAGRSIPDAGLPAFVALPTTTTAVAALDLIPITPDLLGTATSRPKKAGATA